VEVSSTWHLQKTRLRHQQVSRVQHVKHLTNHFIIGEKLCGH